MTSKITSSDIFDINKKSGALILGSNRLDDYATKFLTKYCKEALSEPMPLPVDEILQKMSLKIEEVSLSSNLDIFGCCLLLDGSIDVYNPEIKAYVSTSYSAGTILIDPASVSAYGEGSKRNTLIHEALHWEKDKTYFEILEIKNRNAAEKLYPILCRQSEAFYNPPEGKKTKENEVRWLEWQAHRLAPRVLMPKSSFKKKVTDILKQTDVVFCSGLIRQLSEFFNVSSESAKYRILEVGLMDAISELADYEDVYADIERSVNSTTLTPAQAIQCLNNDRNLRNWVLTGKYIFVDGYFVLDDERFVAETDKGIHLTLKARKNLSKCTVKIREYKNNSLCHSNDTAFNYATLFKIGDVDNRVLLFHPSYQSPQFDNPDDAYKAFSDALSTYNESEEMELVKIIADPEKTLCDCLCFLMDNRNWKYPATFTEQTGLHNNYHGKIKNDNYNNMTTEILMAICVGMKLCLRVTEMLFQKSNNKINYYKDPDKTCIRIMETIPALSIVDFNSILKELGIKELGSVIKE